VAKSYLSLFPVQRIRIELQPAAKADVIERLLEIAVANEALDEDQRLQVLHAMLSREESGSTGVGGVGIPHVKSGLVAKSVAALGVYPRGIDFKAVDAGPVFSVFLLVSPPARADEHVNALRWIATLARKQDYTKFLRLARSVADVAQVLAELGPA